MSDDPRIEVKFVAEQWRYYPLLAWLRMHHFGFVRAYPARWVNNIYFDTHELETYQANAAGMSSRIKIRYRWYGDAPGIGAGRLEVKCKRNHYGWKLSYPVAKSPFASSASWREVIDGFRRRLPPDGRSWLESYPAAVIINRYRRDYFVSREGGVRVTFDARQSVLDQRCARRPNLVVRENLPPALVMEVKCARRNRPLAEEFIRELPLRACRHSKFAAGVAVSA